jgi:hypothetical protein
MLGLDVRLSGLNPSGMAACSHGRVREPVVAPRTHATNPGGLTAFIPSRLSL